MLQKNTIIHLHNAMKIKITDLLNLIKQYNTDIFFQDKYCDKNNPNSYYDFKALNRLKNSRRKAKKQLHKAISVNKKLKMALKTDTGLYNFSINDLEYLLATWKNYDIQLSYDQMSFIKHDIYHYYKTAVPGTKKGLLNFLLLNQKISQRNKKLKSVKRFESVVVDLKQAIQFNYKIDNISNRKQEKSIGKVIQKKIGYVKHNISLIFN